MNRIIKIGMDVHTTNYTLCIFEPSFENKGIVHFVTQVKPNVKNIVRVIDTFKRKNENDELRITCGYEAGCLGYSLYRELKDKGIDCVILAPTTMKTEKGGRKIKNDYRDARMIAECLAYGGYSAVHIPNELDNSVKEYIRMRDDIHENLKKIKQQIISLMTRNGKQFDGKSYWTKKHLDWIKATAFQEEFLNETLDEYMASYEEQEAKIERYDKRIEEIAEQTRYHDKVKKLECFLGIKTHTALSLIVETGDFERFAKGNQYASYLGLAPGENSSSDSIHRLGITKAGNSHLRQLLIEASGGICKGAVGHKSKDLRARQNGNTAEVIAYADKANTRLRSRYYKFIRHGKKRNVAVAAIARELACFVWGMMTDNIEMKAV